MPRGGKESKLIELLLPEWLNHYRCTKYLAPSRWYDEKLCICAICKSRYWCENGCGGCCIVFRRSKADPSSECDGFKDITSYPEVREVLSEPDKLGRWLRYEDVHFDCEQE